MKGLTSIIIPSRNEPYLGKTIDSLFARKDGDIEVIVVLEGYWPDPMPNDRPGLIFINRPVKGMRPTINDGAAISKGEYIMKIDAHCDVAPGFDRKLKDDCDSDWVVIPRRYSLDAELWANKPKTPVDAMYLEWSVPPAYHGKIWSERARERSDVLVDDDMSFQGSCWFMHKDYFDFLELMDLNVWRTRRQEAQEIGLKAWFSGGRLVRNKNVWYSHWHKQHRGFSVSKSEGDDCVVRSAKWIESGDWSKKVRGLNSLVEFFWPVPSWPEDWEKIVAERA